MEKEGGLWNIAGVEEYFCLFPELIQKGMISPTQGTPRDVIISPMSLQERGYSKDREGGEPKSRGLTFGGKGIFSTGFLLQAVRENYIPGYLYQLTNYYDGLFPRTPYGL